jgi:predicted chitinase
MPLIGTHLLDPHTGSMPVYNGLDTMVDFEIDDNTEYFLDDPNSKLIYQFELGMQAPALEMMLRGFRVDPVYREQTLADLQQKLADSQRVLNILSQSIWDQDLNPNSTKQLKSLFYDHMGIKPITRWSDGEVTYPMNRETLESLQGYFYAQPIVGMILLCRDLTKSIQVLTTEIDADLRWRCSYNIGGTKTGRWSSSKSPIGTGCVLPSTEALTPNGWKAVSLLQPGDLIAQWDNGYIKFMPCITIHKGILNGKMFRVEGEQIKQTLTPNHRVLYYNAAMKYKYTDQASSVAKLSQEVIPLGGHYHEGNLSVPKYAAMLMADFSREGKTWRATFKKQRKIDRLFALAEEHLLDCEEQVAKTGYRRFVIRGEQDLPKKWGSWVLQLSLQSATELLEEARYWDATDRGSGFIFFTADKEQAEWFATLAHLVGKSATMRLVEQSEGSYSTTPIWWVNVKDRAHARIQRKLWQEVDYNGEVYCPQIPSSYWLMREDGFISITGNSNFQNITEDLRRNFIPDPGWKLYGIDLEQAESREFGWFCGTILGDWTYLDMIERGDLHTQVARMCWPELPWTGDIKRDRQIADRKFYRHFTYRDACKRLGHGSNYLGTPRTMSGHTKIPVSIVERFQDSYFDELPCIPAAHRWIAQEIQTKHHLINAFGRRRDFFDRTDSDETLRGAVAHMFQSATGDRLNLGLWRLWHYMGGRIQILAQLHDAVYFQARKTDNEREVVSTALDLMKVQLTHTNTDGTKRYFTIPGEAQGGFNWAHRFKLDSEGNRIEWNKYGLDKINLN